MTLLFSDGDVARYEQFMLDQAEEENHERRHREKQESEKELIADKGLFEHCKDVVCSQCIQKVACCEEAMQAFDGEKK